MVSELKKRQIKYFDYTLLFLVIFLLCFGLVMLYSVSTYDGQVTYGDAAYYLKKQLVYEVVGFLAMLFISFLNHRLFKKFAKLFYGISLILCLLVFTPLGTTHHESRRWLKIGGFEFQPSELLKIAVVLMLAAVISDMPKKVQKFKYVVVLAVMFVLVPTLVVFVSNASTAIIIAIIGFSVIFVANKWYLPFVALLGAGVGAGYLFLQFFAYRMERIEVWKNPEAYDKGYQTMQGLYAIGSGGLFGKGLGNSMQKLGNIPEVQNDMVFAVVCEELGIFGAVCVILLFVLLLWRCMVVAMNAGSLFGSLTVTGIMVHIALQVLLNIAVVTNTIPNTGVTLPFFSYGGTSTMLILAEIGIVLSVSRNIKVDPGAGYEE